MTYDLESLHWREFEKLVAFYLKSVIGEGVTIFDGTRDQGRDATFSGQSNAYPSQSNPYTGTWIFQAKHRITRNAPIKTVEQELLRTLNAEITKVFNQHSFSCDHYVYITNINTTNSFTDQAKKVFGDFFGQPNYDIPTLNIVDYKDLEIFISNNTFIRHYFPSLLTYTDLETVFLRKEEVKNEGYLRYAYSNISKFVSTQHYLEAMKRIRESNLLMLVGNPKSGKTSIIEAISLCFLEEGIHKPYYVRNTDEFFKILSYLPPSENALFICDDIFGKHELDKLKLSEWSDYFQSIMGAVAPQHKFVFSTRRYIYEEFANRSGLRMFFPRDSDPTRYVIKLNELSIEEREQILEKHLDDSALTPPFIASTLNARTEILSCKDFSPEVIRSLVSLLTRADIDDVPRVILNHIANPNQYLYDFFNNINFNKRLLLLAIGVSYSNDVNQIQETYIKLQKDTGQKPGSVFQTFLSEIDGSIIKQREYLDSCEIEYYHPSMYEVIIRIFQKDTYYRHLALRNINFDILSLITLKTSSRENSLRIQILVSDFHILSEGVLSLLENQNSLAGITRILKWIKLINIEITYDLHFLKPYKILQKSISIILEKRDFYRKYQHETLQQWISLIDNWRLSAISRTVEYWGDLETLHRNLEIYDYWILVFLIESADPGFIEQTLGKTEIEPFTHQLNKRVTELNAGLHLYKGKPTTHERWFPLFDSVNKLVTVLKASNLGNKIKRTTLPHWDHIKKYNEFCKNRHSGMIKRGHWKPYDQTQSFVSLEQPLTERSPHFFDLGVPLCPSCGAKMVRRTAKRGPNAGESFYGCSEYPNCKQTLPIDYNRT